MTSDELKPQLQQPYNRAAWQTVLREIFPTVSIWSQPHAVHEAHEEVVSFLDLGSVQLHDDKKLAIFEIQLTAQKQLQRNRVGLRNLVANKIDQQTCHGVLVIFTGQGDDYRFTFVAKESEFNEDGEFVERQTATRRFTYLLGPHETCTTAARRLLQLADKKERITLTDVIDAFSVEKLNKEFFPKYKEHYSNFVAHLLSGDIPQQVFDIPQLADVKAQDKANKPVRDFAKRLLGRLVFLHFLQKKGWLGCPSGRTDWKEGDRDFVRNLFRTCPEKEKFFSRCLAPLFYDALNRADRPSDIFFVTNTRVPYLNGGLFEHEHLPHDHLPLPVDKLDFPAVLFENLLEFFGQYNFTIDENDPDDHEVGIDPEMLGHIFENLLEDNKDKGVYYTPKPIVQYMCQQSLIHYLQQHLGEREELSQLVRFKDVGSATDKNNWIKQNARRIEEVLDRVKICDPAIGSGAFPIGLLQEIYWIKLTLDWTLDPAETKLKIIQNSIYGVDIDAGAVEIARLRFWLALIVDEDEPRPLPNLDYKIMQGDSLLESFEGIPLDKLHQGETFQVTVIEKSGQGQMFADTPLFHHTDQSRAQEVVEMIQCYFGETNPTRKQELHREIDRFVLDHIDYNLKLAEEKLKTELHQHQVLIKEKQGQIKDWTPPKRTGQRIVSLERELKSIVLKKEKLQELEEKSERPYFLWHLFFQNVFEIGGFDIVIANPPYISVEKFSRTSIQDQWKEQYKTYASRGDIYCFFYERGIDLLKQNGVLCFISSNKFMRSGYGEKLRNLLLNQTIDVVIDFCELPVFSASTDPAILLLKKSEPVDEHRIFAAVIKEAIEINRLVSALENRGILRPQTIFTSEGWIIEGHDGLFLVKKMRSAGMTLNDFVDGKFYYGIKTGLNEAYVIEKDTRDRLIAEDKKSKELIKPWLRGRDLRRWVTTHNSYYYLIVFPHRFHEKLKDYPAIHKFLTSHEKKLRARGQCKTKRGGGDEGQHHWLELDNNPTEDFLNLFEIDKLVFPIICKTCNFSFVSGGIYSSDKSSFCVSKNPLALLAVLCSSPIEWLIRMTFPCLGDPWGGGRIE